MTGAWVELRVLGIGLESKAWAGVCTWGLVWDVSERGEMAMDDLVIWRRKYITV